MKKEVKTAMSRSFDARNVKVVGLIPWEHSYTLKKVLFIGIDRLTL